MLSVSNWSLSIAAILLVIVLNTPMLLVASGKPSGSPSTVVVFLLAEILVPDRSLSFAVVFVVGPKALMSFVVSDWVHTGCMLTFKRKYYQCYSNAFRFIAIICIYGMHNTI